MKSTLEVLNSLVEERIIEGYGIGGAVAAIRYTEPSETADVFILPRFGSQASAFKSQVSGFRFQLFQMRISNSY